MRRTIQPGRTIIRIFHSEQQRSAQARGHGPHGHGNNGNGLGSGGKGVKTPTASGPPATSLYAQWKADAGVYTDAGTTLATNTQTVQQWNDQSGNGHHLTQASAGSRPSYQTGVKNALPVIRLNGSTNFMTVPGLSYTQYNIFMVFNPVVTGNGKRVFDTLVGASEFDILRQRSGPPDFMDFIGDSGAGSSSLANITDNAYLLFELNFNAATYNYSYAAGALTNCGSGGTNIRDTWNLGGASTIGIWPQIDVAEVLIYNAVLSTANRASANSYLQAKWGV